MFCWMRRLHVWFQESIFPEAFSLAAALVSGVAAFLCWLLFELLRPILPIWANRLPTPLIDDRGLDLELPPCPRVGRLSENGATEGGASIAARHFDAALLRQERDGHRQSERE